RPGPVPHAPEQLATLRRLYPHKRNSLKLEAPSFQRLNADVQQRSCGPQEQRAVVVCDAGDVEVLNVTNFHYGVFVRRPALSGAGTVPVLPRRVSVDDPILLQPLLPPLRNSIAQEVRCCQVSNSTGERWQASNRYLDKRRQPVL